MNTSLLKEVTSCKHLRRLHLTWPSEDAMWLCFSNSLCCTRMHCDDAISMSPLPVTLYHHCKATTMMKQMALKDYWSCHPAGQRKHFSTSRLRVNCFLFEKNFGPVYQLQSFISLALMSHVILNGPASVSPQKASTSASRFGCKVQGREKCQG